MQSRYTIGIVLIGLLVVVVIVYMFTRYVVDPNIVHFDRVHVNENEIILENGSFSGSSVWYGDKYSTYYRDEVLYVTVHGRSFKLFGTKSDRFTVTIPNIYGEIKEIRLDGGKHFNDRTIWTTSS